MSQFTPLGIFLILSFLLPGFIITSTLMILFPNSSSLLPFKKSLEFIGVVLLIAFINGHPAFLFERWILDPLWNKIFDKWRLKERRELVDTRSQIIADAEIHGFTHNHYNQTFGEFILFNNTAFWLFSIAVLRLIFSPPAKTLPIAIVILIGSLACMLFVSPFFKKSYIDILEALQKQIQPRHEEEATDTNNESYQKEKNVSSPAGDKRTKR